MLVCDCGRLQVFEIVGKMAKGWINNNIVRRSCCVHHVSTGVEHNSCEVRPEEDEQRKDSCYNTWTPHSTWTPHTTHGHYICTCTNTLTPLIIEYVRSLKTNTCKCLFVFEIISSSMTLKLVFVDIFLQ